MRLRWALSMTVAAGIWGFIGGTLISHRKQQGPEQPAPAIVHKDGSITLERASSPPPPPLPEPPETVARTRAALLNLKPLPTSSQIQLDLVTMKDGSQRITAKGPALVGGQDFPVSVSGHVPKWTVGVTWDGTRYSGIVLKQSGPWIFGLEAGQGRAAAMIGFRF